MYTFRIKYYRDLDKKRTSIKEYTGKMEIQNDALAIKVDDNTSYSIALNRVISIKILR